MIPTSAVHLRRLPRHPPPLSPSPLPLLHLHSSLFIASYSPAPPPYLPPSLPPLLSADQPATHFARFEEKEILCSFLATLSLSYVLITASFTGDQRPRPTNAITVLVERLRPALHVNYVTDPDNSSCSHSLHVFLPRWDSPPALRRSAFRGSCPAREAKRRRGGPACGAYIGALIVLERRRVHAPHIILASLIVCVTMHKYSSLIAL